MALPCNMVSGSIVNPFIASCDAFQSRFILPVWGICCIINV
jgi:hypothetical protein